MTKSLMPGLVYACGCMLGTERPRGAVAANMALIAFGVVVCALGEVNLVPRGLAQQLAALMFEVGRARGGRGRAGAAPSHVRALARRAPRLDRGDKVLRRPRWARCGARQWQRS